MFVKRNGYFFLCYISIHHAKKEERERSKEKKLFKRKIS